MNKRARSEATSHNTSVASLLVVREVESGLSNVLLTVSSLRSHFHRVKQCAEGKKHVCKDAKELSDATMDEFNQCVDSFDGDKDALWIKRARHVVTENERVEKAVKALKNGEWEALGGFMNASHESLKDDFAVSCDELDLLVDITR